MEPSDISRQMVDDFFNFDFSRPQRRYEMPKPLQVVPIREPPKERQTMEREQSGTAYVHTYNKRLEKDLSHKFSKLNASTASDLSSQKDKSTLNSTVRSTLSKSLFMNHRNDLPIFESRDDIIHKVLDNQVVIITGKTGCGKSTQVPQYIFDSCKSLNMRCNILVSQPRKIAAITIAQRVAMERKVVLGQEVGYQVGLNKKMDVEVARQGSSIMYCTTGVILQRLIHEKHMNRYSHIILDEVHERDIEIDFLLIVIRKMMAQVSCNTKIILMSATLDSKQFSKFLKMPLEDGAYFVPPIIDLNQTPRTYEISIHYLEEFGHFHEETEEDLVDYDEPGIADKMYDLAMKVLLMFLRHPIPSSKIKTQTILIFLPGLYEIECFNTKVTSRTSMASFKAMDMTPDICILHSSLSTKEQEKAFETGQNPKIILSTNLAESGVTIPNVTHVIDFCLTKNQAILKGAQISSLVLDWCSQNNCKQRSGRTGRVCPGIVARLVHKEFYENQMREYPAPEMTRIGLETVIIRAKLLEMGSPLELLALALDPPDKSSVVDAVLHLKELGGLLRFDERNQFSYDDGVLTFLGRVMGSLPVDAAITKFIILGYLFSVLDETIIIGAGLSLKSIFTQQFGRKMDNYSKKMKWAHGTQSDCIAILNAYNLWEKYCMDGKHFGSSFEKAWCVHNNLDVKNIHEMRLLVQEIRSRLLSHSIKHLEQDQPMWNEKDRTFILKIVIAGAFGASNFFIPNRMTQDIERNIYNSVSHLDVFRTVYFKGMDLNLIGEVYEDHLRTALIKKGIIDKNSKPEIAFDNPSSEKVFVTFEERPDQIVESNFNGGNISAESEFSKEDITVGRVPLEIHKAVKHRHLEGKFEIPVMDLKETKKYAVAHGLGTFNDDGIFTKTVHYIENPAYCVEPTLGTVKMHGYVTHVEHCTKFFFRPVEAVFESSEKDNRYKQINEYLQKWMDEAEREAATGVKLNEGQFVVAMYKEKLERGKFISKSGRNIVQVYLMDRGHSVELENKHVFLVKEDVEKVLIEFTPRCFECTLTEIQPSSIHSHEGKWTQRAIQIFRHAVVDVKATIHIYSVIKDIASVTLSVKRQNWNHQLIQMGFAEDCEESYISKANHDLRVLNRRDPKTPEEEYTTKIDEKVKMKKIPAPHLSMCKKTLKLIGPFSPLEGELRGISRMSQTKIAIDPSSVNSVILNDDIMNFRGKFLVAAEVTINSKNNTMTARESTVMPNVPGLPVLLALIFSPTAELRRDNMKNRYVSVLTGLGFDPKRKQPFYGERDAYLNIDFELTEADLCLINKLRSHMSQMLVTPPDQNLPDIVDGQKADILVRIQSTIFEILNKIRPVMEIAEQPDPLDWNVDQRDRQNLTDPHHNLGIYRIIGIPPLQEMSEEMKQKLRLHAAELNDCVRKQLTIHKKVCRLCDFEWQTLPQLKIHLLSKKHIRRCERLEN